MAAPPVLVDAHVSGGASQRQAPCRPTSERIRGYNRVENGIIRHLWRPSHFNLPHSPVSEDRYCFSARPTLLLLIAGILSV